MIPTDWEDKMCVRLCTYAEKVDNHYCIKNALLPATLYCLSTSQHDEGWLEVIAKNGKESKVKVEFPSF